MTSMRIWNVETGKVRHGMSKEYPLVLNSTERGDTTVETSQLLGR